MIKYKNLNEFLSVPRRVDHLSVEAGAGGADGARLSVLGQSHRQPGQGAACEGECGLAEPLRKVSAKFRPVTEIKPPVVPRQQCKLPKRLHQ